METLGLLALLASLGLFFAIPAWAAWTAWPQHRYKVAFISVTWSLAYLWLLLKIAT